MFFLLCNLNAWKINPLGLQRSQLSKRSELGKPKHHQIFLANLVRLGISIHYRLYIRSQYLARFFSLYSITDGQTTQSLMEVMLPPTGIDSILFQSSISTVAGQQVHTTTPGQNFEKYIFLSSLSQLRNYVKNFDY